MANSARRILMLYPRGGEFDELGEHPMARWMGIYRFSPLPLLTVAAYLPADWEIRLIDENVEPIGDADIDWADYVLMSGMIMHYAGLVRLAERAAARGKHVVVGGPLALTSRRLLEGRHGIGTLCLNECEPYIDELVADMRAGTVKALYGESGLPAEMARVATPRFDLLRNSKKYLIHSVQTSRGCPFTCEYCDVHVNAGNRWRHKTAEQVLAELEAIRRTATTPCSLFVWDDNFAGSMAKAKDLLRAIGAWQKAQGYPFLLATQLALHVADDAEMLDLMYQANLRVVYCGIESASEASLAEANKGHNAKRDMAERVADFQRAGIDVAAYLMIGFDADPPDIARRQLELVEQARTAIILPSTMIALDRTPFSERLAREGRLSWSVGDNPTEANRAWAWGDMNFQSRRAALDIKRDFIALLDEPYRPRSWYRRTRLAVERFPERDREHLLVPPRLSMTTLSLALTAVMMLPGRLRMLWEAAALLVRTGRVWKVWRYFELLLTADVTCAHEYRARVKVMRRRLAEAAAAPAATS